MTVDTTPAVRPLYEIADEIVGDWSKPSIHAQPYIEAMQSLGSINDTFWLDSARSVVVYFLANAQGWRGDTARRIKKELNAML